MSEKNPPPGNLVSRQDFSMSNNMSLNLLLDVQNFHEKFQIPCSLEPCLPDEETATFRLNRLQEEVNEYDEAIQEGDMAKACDALVDLVYIAIGNALIHGYPMAEVWSRVHKANMAKVRATSADQSRHGTTLDIIKPEGWVPANFDDLFPKVEL